MCAVFGLWAVIYTSIAGTYNSALNGILDDNESSVEVSTYVPHDCNLNNSDYFNDLSLDYFSNIRNSSDSCKSILCKYSLGCKSYVVEDMGLEQVQGNSVEMCKCVSISDEDVQRRAVEQKCGFIPLSIPCYDA